MDPHGVVSAQTTEKVSTVIEMMKEKGISQLPVSDDHGYIKGLVTEASILSALYEERCQPGDAIESLVDASIEFVNQSDGIEKISSLVAAGKTPLVMDPDTGTPVAVLTKIDLLSYLSQGR
jgi:predicted transcriptional regulator